MKNEKTLKNSKNEENEQKKKTCKIKSNKKKKNGRKTRRKKRKRGPTHLWWYPCGHSFPFFLFSSFFSPVVLTFFLLFILSFFLFFCSFSPFFDFLKCFSFFHFFWKKKVSSFLFSCISFKYVLLLALVSDFNCFLRSRCSMEMWCPDDRGRDSWDWFGPPAWRRACFNSPEWGGAPVKTEPPQILLLLLLFLQTICVCSQTPGINCAKPVPSHLGVATPGDSGTPQPSTHKCECSRAPKNRLTQKNRTLNMLKIQEARRNYVQISQTAGNHGKTVRGLYQQNQYGTCHCCCRRCAGQDGESTSEAESKPRHVENQKNLPKATLDDAQHVSIVEPGIARPLSRCTNGQNNLVQELDDTQNSNCGDPTVFCTTQPRHLSLQTTGTSTTTEELYL